LRWARELTEASETGIKILDAWFPAQLDIPAEELIAALGSFMTDARKGSGLSRAKEKQLRDVFAASSLSILLRAPRVPAGRQIAR
jgi:hypothetical protein